MAEKLDVIDLIISTLREHERSLDEVSRELRETSGELGRSAEDIREAAHLFREAIETLRPSMSESESHTPKPPEPSRENAERDSQPDQIQPRPMLEHPSDEEALSFEKAKMKETLRQILRLLDKYGFLSLTDLSRMVSEGSRNWLSGFMAALEALDIVKRRGTATHKIYILTERGKRKLEEI